MGHVRSSELRVAFFMLALLVLLGASGVAKAQKKVTAHKQSQHKILDRDRDGICDICNQHAGSGLKNTQGKKAKAGYHYGPGNGTGNQGTTPKDGSGYGAKSGKQSGSQNGVRVGQKKPGIPGAKTKSKGRPRRRP